MIQLKKTYKKLKKKTTQFTTDLKAAWYLSRNNVEPVIIYQMGKVGSRSIKDSLVKYGVHPVFHVHRLKPDNIIRLKKEYYEKTKINLHETTGLRIYNKICKKNRKAKFLTVVREPVSRNISAFFQNLIRFTGYGYDELKMSTDELIQNFISTYPHNVPLEWFDIELKSTLGIDIYDHEFSKEKGYSTIKKGNFELLILKLELPDHQKQKIISEYMQLDDFKIIRSNVANDKKYSVAYRNFKTKINLPSHYLERMLDSKYTRHFYSDPEINEIWSKWNTSKKARGNA